jgi:hypothetical protein
MRRIVRNVTIRVAEAEAAEVVVVEDRFKKQLFFVDRNSGFDENRIINARPRSG